MSNRAVFYALALVTALVASIAFSKPTDNFFKNTYTESREAFLRNAEELKKLVPALELRSVAVQSERAQGLFTDSIYLPAPSGKKKRLLILVSGMHGIEGFVGSALQNKFLANEYGQLQDPDLGVLVIHAMNPYGFQFGRRVTEHNVDLNRNFDTDKNLFALKNDGYEKVRTLLNPTSKADSGFSSRAKYYVSAGVAIVQHSMDSLRRAVLKGQYQFPDGIYYGGKDFEPQKLWLEKELLDRAAGYEEVLLIDLHTGYGERGQLHLFADRSDALDADYLQRIFAGQNLDYGQKKDFYEVTGGLVVFAAKLLQGKTKFAGIVFEFGTLNSQKTLGSLDSIYRMSKENQLSLHGAQSTEDEENIRGLFLEMFYPSSPEWRASVADQFRTAVLTALKNQRQN